MIPFGEFLYFGILLYLAFPVVALALLRVPPRRFLLATTLLMVAIQYGIGRRGLPLDPIRDVGRVLGFAVAQLAIARGFLAIRARGRRRAPFYAAVAIALVPLAAEKLVPGSRGVVAFVGISYATFRALDVIFVVQDGLVKELPPAEYLAYLLFFPAISAGPIDRYVRFRRDYRADRDRAQLAVDLDAAVERYFRGMLYGFVLAPLIEHYWMTPVAARGGVLAIASYMYAYSLHLFFDFAGYSAFAIGTGYVLGVRMLENFDRPFEARNIAEFWSRWHISLSTWLRDHVFGRFVLTAAKRRWFRDPHSAGAVGSVLAFGLMGLWHGPQARYIVYGLYHALLIVAHAVITRGRRRHVPRIVGQLVTFHLVCFGFLIFSGRLF
jgi:membrane protein involved in D-alanine export